MKALSTFLPFVLPYVYGCSDPMAEQAILSACIEFCERSLLVQNVSYETTVVGQADYDVEEPPQLQLAEVLAVFYLRDRLKACSLEMVTDAVAVRGENFATVEIAPGTPREWFVRDPVQALVSVYPPPDTAVAGGLTVRAAHKPLRTATSVPDVLFNEYATSIAAGAIAHLVSMPAQPFTAPAVAGPHRAMFLAAAASAAIKARTGTAAASSRVKPVHFS